MSGDVCACVCSVGNVHWCNDIMETNQKALRVLSICVVAPVKLTVCASANSRP